VASLFLLGVLVIVLCVGFQINPFRETTTSFLGAAFAGLIGVAALLVLLNVAANLSLIADASIAELKVEPRRGLPRKWGIAFLVAAVAVVGMVFAGTYFSKERYLAIVHSQADEILKLNGTLLDEISQLLASGRPDDYKRVSEIRNFLENQRTELPQLTVIYSGRFEGKLAFYRINGYVPYDEEKKVYTPRYFSCTRNLDCDYLTRFFSGQKAEVLQRSAFRDDQFFIYIPIEGKESRFVLLFDRRNSYGKIGS
jgi:hypothetical protein